MIDKESKEKFDLLKEIREQEEQEIIEKFQNYIQTRYGTQYTYCGAGISIKSIVDHESERYKDRFEDFKKRLENGEDYDDIISKAKILRFLSVVGMFLFTIAPLIFCDPADNFLVNILVFISYFLISLFLLSKNYTND